MDTVSILSAILSRVLEISEESITDQTGPENVSTWDSFNGLLLVSELEEAYGVEFTMKEITGVKTVGDIKAVLAKHGIEGGHV